MSDSSSRPTLIVATRVFPLEPLAFAGAEQDGVDRGDSRRGRHVEAVEAAGLAPVALAQVVREAAVGRVEIQEAGPRSAPEAVDDVGRRAHAAARPHRVLVVADEKGHLAFEHVERVGVVSMQVRIGARACVGEVRLRDAELVEGHLDHDPAAEERLALAGPVNDGAPSRASMTGSLRPVSRVRDQKARARQDVDAERRVATDVAVLNERLGAGEVLPAADARADDRPALPAADDAVAIYADDAVGKRHAGAGDARDQGRVGPGRGAGVRACRGSAGHRCEQRRDCRRERGRERPAGGRLT